MTERMDLSRQERYDIVAYRIECAEKTLGEIDNLLALKYYQRCQSHVLCLLLCGECVAHSQWHHHQVARRRKADVRSSFHPYGHIPVVLWQGLQQSVRGASDGRLRRPLQPRRGVCCQALPQS